MRTILTKVRMNPANEVQVVDAYLAQADTDFALVIDAINNTNKIVTFLKLDVLFINAFGKFIFDETVFQHSYEGLALKPKSLSYLPHWILDERHHTARGVRIRIAEVHFDDGTRNYYDRTKETLFTVPIIPKEKKDELKKLFGPDFYTYGDRTAGMWRCICGFTNADEDAVCRHCSRSKAFVLSAVTERQVNKKLFQLYVNKDRDFADRATAYEETMPIRPLDEIDLERGMGSEASPSKRKSGLLFLLVAAAVIALTVFAFHVYDGISTKRNYEKAQSYIAMGDYDEAEAIYDDLPPTVGNVDMALKIQELDTLKNSDANYNKALELSRSGDTLAAYAAYKKVVEEDRHNYANARAMMESIQTETIMEANRALAKGNKKDAEKIFDALLALDPKNLRLLEAKADAFTR
ncbi:tetratricopeptide repeat protein [Aedoeadaptatus urinae]|uniref:tetratricopeptide repeat protein n=1 Tax=Aedoeadaptatus urinae TaxID=1871017 RepID=UPI00097DC1C8|nr:hypothetical protein [Peptoniphilus urinae]